jgi:hypothetical protein
MRTQRTPIASLFALALGTSALALPALALEPVTEDRHGPMVHQVMERLARGEPVVPSAHAGAERARGVAAGETFAGVTEDRHGPTLHHRLRTGGSGYAEAPRTERPYSRARDGSAQRGLAAGEAEGLPTHSRAQWAFWDRLTNRQ